jgi:hypothetical protein
LKDQRHNGEFHRADPAWRRRMQGVLAVSALLGLAAIAALYVWLSRMDARLSAGDLFAYVRALNQIMAGVCIAIGLAAAAFAAWMFRLAAATRAERRWPPSTMRTSADMQIRYLTSADALVTQMRAGAFVLAVLAIGLLAWGAWLLLKPA